MIALTRLAIVAAALCFADQASGQALTGYSPTGQPTSFAVTGKFYVVDGFRGAKWGMSEDKVRTAIAADFPGFRVVTRTVNVVNHTSILVIYAPSLEPGPGPAAVTYIFGADSGGLFHVNLDWRVDHASAADREVLTAAGAKAVAEFIGYYWKLLSVARGAAEGPHSLVLFAGEGQTGGNVDVRLLGVGFTLHTPQGRDVVLPPPPDGAPVLLHIDIARSANPTDVYKITPGSF
jgi:hypothetical protein